MALVALFDSKRVYISGSEVKETGQEGDGNGQRGGAVVPSCAAESLQPCRSCRSHLDWLSDGFSVSFPVA